MNDSPLKRTPLFAALVQAGGRMVDFHGWELPVQFAGILAEHQAVRTACGVFDVSHMGQVFIAGPEAHRFVERVNCNRMSAAPGQGTYAHILAEDGGILDDAITFCLAPDRFLAVVNAATAANDFAWFQGQAAGLNVKLDHASERYGMLAVQGPQAPALVAEIFPAAAGLPRFGIAEVPWAGATAFVMRTGYTGEDGFEVAASPAGTLAFWAALRERGGKHGLQPCGLGARDTLRLEAGYLLYGADADESRTPYEAGCGWVVKLQKGDFIGREALIRRREAGFREKLTGVRLLGRGVPRPGCAVWAGERKLGALCSATFAPSLGTGIGVGYLTAEAWEPGTGVEWKSTASASKPKPSAGNSAKIRSESRTTKNRLFNNEIHETHENGSGHFVQRRELQDHGGLYRSVQGEGLRVSGGGLSGMPGTGIQESRHSIC
jgi:aminomethyltransferase